MEEDNITRCFFPAEFNHHRATLLLFPHSSSTFILHAATKEFTAVVVALAVDGEEDVVVFFKPGDSSALSSFWDCVDADCARRGIGKPSR